MFITKARHRELMLEDRVRFTDECRSLVKKRDKEITELKEQLEKAKSLESILNKLADESLRIVSCGEVDLPDKYPVYVDDLLGSEGDRVIKQEANKALLIDPDGGVEVGYTKTKCDKGFKYVLKRV